MNPTDLQTTPPWRLAERAEAMAQEPGAQA